MKYGKGWILQEHYIIYQERWTEVITQSLSQLHTDSAAGIQAQPACLCAVSGQARAPLSEALAAMHDNRENRLLGAALTQNTTGGAAIILRRKYSYSLGLVTEVSAFPFLV